MRTDGDPKRRRAAVLAASAAIAWVVIGFGATLTPPVPSGSLVAERALASSSKPGAVLRFEMEERRLFDYDPASGTTRGRSDKVVITSGWVDQAGERVQVEVESPEAAYDWVLEDGVVRSLERRSGGASAYREIDDDGTLEHYYSDITSWSAAIRDGSARVEAIEVTAGVETVRVRMMRDVEPLAAGITEMTANLRTSDGLPVWIRNERRVRYPGSLLPRTERVEETLVRAEYVDVARVPASAFVLEVPEGASSHVDRTFDRKAAAALKGREVFWLGEEYGDADASPFYDSTRPGFMGTVFPSPGEPPLWRFSRFTDRHVVVGYLAGGDDRTWESRPVPSPWSGTEWTRRRPVVRVSSMPLDDVAREYFGDPESFAHRGKWREMLTGADVRVEHDHSEGCYVAQRVGDTVVVTMAEELAVARDAADRVRPVGR